MTKSEEAIIIDGIGAYAVTFFEMGDSPEIVREKLLAEWRRFGKPIGVFDAAAKAIGGFPQPVLESAETTERKRAILEKLGAQGPEEQLVAALRGRELLEDLAKEFG